VVVAWRSGSTVLRIPTVGARTRRGQLDAQVHKGGYTLVTLPRTVTSYRDSVDGTRDHVTYQKLVKR
jgi:hypothetical protein